MKNLYLQAILTMTFAVFFSFTMAYGYENSVNTTLEYTPQNQFFPKHTKQEVLSTCFSYFENLYFSQPSSEFICLGKKINVHKSINGSDHRGFSWKQDEELNIPFAKTTPIYGTTIFIFEKGVTGGHFTHYFHFLEHLLGLWNFGAEIGCQDVKLFVLAGNGFITPSNWKGDNDIICHLIRALFPNAEIRTWDSFIMDTKDKVVCFERAFTSDRSMEIFNHEPYRTERMLGGYFQNLKKNSLQSLASSVWRYCGIKKSPSKKLRITYVQRAHNRFLTSECEKQLITKISSLTNYELNIVDFAAIPFDQQIRIVAATDVLIGVHGNGLSHTLFLPNKACLIELFPANSFRVEYRIFAKSRDLDYFAWVDKSGWVTDATAETLGCHGNIFVSDLETNVDSILAILKTRQN